MIIQNLSLNLDGKELLKDISLEIPKGSIYALLGPNGAGKTLLLRCLASLHKPTRGSIEQRPSDLAWIPLSQALPFAFSVKEILLMGRFAQHQGFPGARDLTLAKGAAEKLGIFHLWERSYNSLSRGEQTKVDIARALGSEAKVWLLDEPFSNLDIDGSLSLIELLQQLRAQGYTFILSHHDLYSVRALATDAVLIKEGRVVKDGPIHEVFAKGPLREAYNVEAILSGEGPESFIRFEKVRP